MKPPAAHVSFFRDRRAPQQLQRVFRLVFAGGGTGGHLAPGIAIAEEIQQQLPCEVTFFTTGKPVEDKMLEGVSAQRVKIPAAPPSFSLKRGLKFVGSTISGYAKALKHLRRERPHAVVALGGYGALPAALAARTLSIPLVICEQNVIPGRATRFLSRWARICLTQFPLPEYQLHERCRQVVRGNPVRAGIMQGDRLRALHELGLDSRKRTIVMCGGSQGAAPLCNSAILNRGLLKQYDAYAQFVLLTGQAAYQTVAANFRNHANVRVLPFSNDMGDLLAAADLVVSRSGATTISECTALGKPMVLVPYPHAKDAHQLHNALYVARAGAAMVYDESHFDADAWRVAIEGVLLNDWDRYAMSDASRHLGRPDAAVHIVTELTRIMGASRARDEGRTSWLASRRLTALPQVIARPKALAGAMMNHPHGHPPDLAHQLDLPDLRDAA